MIGDPIETVAVIGAGRMGHGIALVYALDGNDVRLYDADEEILASSQERIERALETLVGAAHISPDQVEAALDNVDCTPDFEDCVCGADLITEAVVEDLDIKRAVFQQLDEHAAADVILATNTSGLSIDDIAAPVNDASRVLGTHWFNPPYIVPLVEIVKGEATIDEAVTPVSELLSSAGKTPVVVQQDIPGFIGNRIQTAMAYEAFSLLAHGVATPEDIDKAVKAGFGFRLPIMGIFEKVDQSGLDIHHTVERQLMPALDRGTQPNPVVEELLERGETGTEVGKGVYDWTGVDTETIERTRDQALLSLYETYRETAETPSPPGNYDRT